MQGSPFLGVNQQVHARISPQDSSSSKLRFPRHQESTNSAASTVLVDDFPSQRSHAPRYLAMGPDHKLYVGVGEFFF